MTNITQYTHNHYAWRPVDIAVTATVGVASGLVFWGFNYVSAWLFPLMRTILPGTGSLFHAIWYFSGPLALLIIRKPGAAVFVNLVGSAVEMLLGNQFSVSFVFVSAIVQALFSELAFAIFLYKRWTLSISMLSGLLTAIEYGFYLLFFQYQGVSFFSAYGITHMICEMIGGVLIGGVMSWYLFIAIAKTGALDKFASGRSVKAKVA
ncbi:ECF transporter S component [Bifidobacterium aquikefiricola]|uniref:ECF transporter S component n=1 Tax=Bifidobacterium aquikefiricola TaxID=3059038 RepID=A0AB39U874_9BIFI